MTKNLSRKQLYDLVWEKPMVEVAKDHGLSDRGLAKLCERNGIPVPPRGYWAKKQAGYKVRQPPLPIRKEERPEQITIQKYEYAPPEEIVQVMETARQKVQTRTLVPLSSPEGSCILPSKPPQRLYARSSHPLKPPMQTAKVIVASLWDSPE